MVQISKELRKYLYHIKRPDTKHSGSISPLLPSTRRQGVHSRGFFHCTSNTECVTNDSAQSVNLLGPIHM